MNCMLKDSRSTDKHIIFHLAFLLQLYEAKIYLYIFVDLYSFMDPMFVSWESSSYRNLWWICCQVVEYPQGGGPKLWRKHCCNMGEQKPVREPRLNEPTYHPGTSIRNHPKSKRVYIYMVMYLCGVVVLLFLCFLAPNTSRCHSMQQVYLKHWSAYTDIHIMHKQLEFSPAPFWVFLGIPNRHINCCEPWWIIYHVCPRIQPTMIQPKSDAVMAKVLSPDSGDQRCNHVTCTWFTDDFDLILTATLFTCGLLCVEASWYHLYRWCLPLAGELIHCLAANSLTSTVFVKWVEASNYS